MNFMEYWQFTDWLTKFLFFVLFGLSVTSWIVGIIRLINSHKLKNIAAKILQQRAKTLQEETQHMVSQLKKQYAEQAMLQEINAVKLASETGLAVLGTTATIAPFIGLFGTVWGIFHALHAIGQTGQAGLGQVAGPVGEALIMTGLGLAVAIPAVIFYNLCLRFNRHALHHTQHVAHQILMQQLL